MNIIEYMNIHINISRLNKLLGKITHKKLCPLTFKVSSMHVDLRSKQCSRRCLDATSTGTRLTYGGVFVANFYQLIFLNKQFHCQVLREKWLLATGLKK
jgi:hypothetical protein